MNAETHAMGEGPEPANEMESREDALLKITMHEGVAVATFGISRILDESDVQQLGDKLDELVEKQGFTKIVLDFKNVRYIGSLAVGLIFKLHKRVRAAGGLRLCNVQPDLRQAFRPLVSLSALPKIRNSLDEAIEELLLAPPDSDGQQATKGSAGSADSGLGPGEELETREGALLRITVYDDVAVVSLTKSEVIDSSHVEQLAEELDDLVEKRRVTKIVADLEGVAFLSSSALGQFYSLCKNKLKPLGGGLRVCGIPKYRPLAPPLLFVCESVQEAVSQLRKLNESGRSGCLVFVCLAFVVVGVMLLFCA